MPKVESTEVSLDYKVNSTVSEKNTRHLRVSIREDHVTLFVGGTKCKEEAIFLSRPEFDKILFDLGRLNKVSHLSQGDARFIYTK